MKGKVRVYHALYGCETGCCGHVIEIDNEKVGKFQFSHPYGDDKKEFAKELAEEVIRESSPQCLDSIDWDSLDYSEVSDY